MIPDPLGRLLRYPGNFVLAKEYLDAGCTIQAHNFIDAIESLSVDSVVWLLENGADANAKLGCSSILTVAMESYCSARDSCDISKILIPYYAKESIQKLLEYGAMPEYDEIRMSILTRDVDMVRWCLEANKKFELDLGLLGLAIENSDITGYAVLEALLENVKVRNLLGSKIDGFGQPLVLALLKAPKLSQTMRLLLKNGAPPNSYSELGHSVLELAYQMNLMVPVLFLLSAGSTLDPNGRMRLLLAHDKANLDLIDCLEAFLMIQQGSRCPHSILALLPTDTLNEILTLIILIGARAYNK